ncbi:MAG: hypothetical protein CMN78_03285 [Spirochaetales bacterium]|nr:hypothetical protein [Spirochaetales bacterium]
MSLKSLLLPSVLPIILLGSCGLFAEEDEEILPELPEPPRVARSITYAVAREDMYEAIEGTAKATPVKNQTLYFLVGGRIRAIEIEPEEEVSGGAVLAKLEIDDLEHQLALAIIDRDIADANLNRMKITSAPASERRIQELVLAKYELNVSYLQKRVEAASIRAPFDGIIQRVQAKVSDRIKEYEPVIEISDPTTLEMQMNVSENEFYEIRPTMYAEVMVDADTWVPAHIIQTTHLNPRQDATVRREEYIVHLQVDETQYTLTTHDRMPGRIVLSKQIGALVIPAAGLREFNGRTYVRVLEGEARREVDVKVGLRTDTKIEIIEGLDEGELVIGK